jgi:hypothetical protein
LEGLDVFAIDAGYEQKADISDDINDTVRAQRLYSGTVAIVARARFSRMTGLT